MLAFARHCKAVAARRLSGEPAWLADDGPEAYQLAAEEHYASARDFRTQAADIVRRQNKGGIARLLAAGNPAVTELTMAVIGGLL